MSTHILPPYTLVSNRRAKRLSIRIRANGTVRVTKPVRVSVAMAHAFVEQKASWIVEKIHVLSKAQTVAHTKKEILELKVIAQKRAEEKVIFFNRYYQFTYNTISIKNQKTRWGSCSKKGNLNFNYRIATLPERLADYLVVHELCHLGQFNHSQKFWDLVGEVLPDYKVLRKELRGVLM